MRRVITIRLVVSLRTMIGGLAALLLALAATKLGADNVTLTTYYPAPSGVYARMITTSDTYLSTINGKVGIGTTGPTNKLSVNGAADFLGNILLNNHSVVNQIICSPTSVLKCTKNGNVVTITYTPAASASTCGGKTCNAQNECCSESYCNMILHVCADNYYCSGNNGPCNANIDCCSGFYCYLPSHGCMPDSSGNCGGTTCNFDSDCCRGVPHCDKTTHKCANPINSGI